ncbi:MAG: succinyl-diaminopimelate desuccinylase [Gammaproteobacteria bacterium WSBS_2016_MAG_OTU1]
MDSIELLKKLICCKSITPQEAGALDLAEEILSAAGFTCRRLPSNGVDNLWATDDKSPQLVFAGHVDVVPPGDENSWKFPPFEATEEDGYIYGRGATDMKSAVAAMLQTACRLRQDNIEGVAVLLTADEEGPATDGTRHVVEWWQKNGGGKIPFVIVGEPTCSDCFGDAIKIGRRGSLTGRLTILGKQAHVAYPHRGDNPTHRLAAVINDLLEQIHKKWPPNKTAKVDFPPIGVQMVRFIADGGADNIIPDKAEATINFRYSPHETVEELKELTKMCLQRAAGDKWQCDWTHGAKPFITNAEGTLITALQESIDEVCGVRAILSTGGGTSDGRFLRTMCEQLVEFGVVNKTMHAIDECVEIATVRQLADIYEKTARRLLG